jgi:two-component system sensor histidine kinase/response regulator
MADHIGHVLAVDDDRMSLMMLSRSLKQIGHTVTTASNGREALEKLDAETFDLMVLDCMMPEMDGYEVLETLNAKPVKKDVPVIMLSGVEDMASVVTCIELGATDYLAKPFDPALLRARINNTLAQKRSREREAKLFADLEANYRQLRELESLRDSLIHMIVHDLRTPLTSVIGGLDALPMLATFEGDAADLLAMASRSSHVLLAMINELLDIHRMESGAPILERAEVPIGDAVAAACALVAPLAEQARVRIDVEPVEAGVSISGDRTKLERVFVNLVGNAIKFTRAGGNVAVSVREIALGREGVEIEVRDDGEGMPPDAVPRIFDRFYQVATRTGGRAMSTGLGLTFCKMVVEAHGGRIDVKSAPGEGSSFTVVLPRTGAEAAR